MEITVDQMYHIENKGHEMGFLKKFIMENAGAASVRRLVDTLGNVESKNILIFAGVGNNRNWNCKYHNYYWIRFCNWRFRYRG